MGQMFQLLNGIVRKFPQRTAAQVFYATLFLLLISNNHVLRINHNQLYTYELIISLNKSLLMAIEGGLLVLIEGAFHCQSIVAHSLVCHF